MAHRPVEQTIADNESPDPALTRLARSFRGKRRVIARLSDEGKSVEEIASFTNVSSELVTEQLLKIKRKRKRATRLTGRTK